MPPPTEADRLLDELARIKGASKLVPKLRYAIGELVQERNELQIKIDNVQRRLGKLSPGIADVKKRLSNLSPGNPPQAFALADGIAEDLRIPLKVDDSLPLSKPKRKAWPPKKKKLSKP